MLLILLLIEGTNYLAITSSDAKNAFDALYQNKLLNTLYLNQLHKQEPYIHSGIREATSPRFFTLEKAQLKTKRTRSYSLSDLPTVDENETQSEDSTNESETLTVIPRIISRLN